ncbi:sterol desaturase family protein [Bermanella sp. WJH001]|uniref:sterol desaturase family protein n=1 Tax=Bermanella sp. WJH001 TaxID=3048005 RepID=UPI0024BEF2E2|nr:sterol desaturase family protein [Bermanella sp. WJH001]MDJ1537156.1 sterol desaturase family protein [Bermanella sp. WJH001]
MNYILMAIPVFFVLIMLELAWTTYKKQDVYRLNDAVNSLAMGIMSRITQILYAAVPFSFYVYFYEDFALFEWQSNVWTWLAAFVLYDFSYYWVHRIGHTMNISWASHVIHHSSEEYNLSTALRQTSVPNVIGWVFYIPLAFMGFPPEILVAVGSLNLLYQFWVHTQAIDQMPRWYEFIFVTPSNHRVHHAKNKMYVDKNFGGVFLWDRLFGTFQPELKEEKVIFGISTQLASWNPVWGNLHFLAALCQDAWRTKSWKDKFTLWFRRTGYRPADVEAKYPVVKSNQVVDKYDTPLTLSAKLYVIVQLTVISLGIFVMMHNIENLVMHQHFSIGLTLAFALYSLGKVQEGNDNALLTELMKYGLLMINLVWLTTTPEWLSLTTLSIGVLSLIWLYSIQKHNNEMQTV